MELSHKCIHYAVLILSNVSYQLWGFFLTQMAQDGVNVGIAGKNMNRELLGFLSEVFRSS